MKIRFRYLFMGIGCLTAAGALRYLVADDATGVMSGIVKDWLLGALRYFFGIAAMFYGFRSVTDYDSADGDDLHKTAGTSPVGAGLALIYRGLTFVAVALILMTFSKAIYAAEASIPQQAYQHLPVLKGLMRAHFPQHPRPEVIAGQLEHESGCPGLKRMCWNVSARLKSAREDGVGIPQITRAFYVAPDGSRGAVRFDALAELKSLHPELDNVTWANIGARADYQLLVAVLKNRDNWAGFRTIAATPDDQMRFALKSYNRGRGGVMAEIRACANRPGCNPKRFAGNAGDVCTASWKPIYGKQSPCSISLRYVPDIVEHRAPKYRGLV